MQLRSYRLSLSLFLSLSLQVSLALEAGVRHIDTATGMLWCIVSCSMPFKMLVEGLFRTDSSSFTREAYGNEKEIGKAWKASGLARDEIKLSSKLCNTDLRSGNVRKVRVGNSHQSLQ